LKVRLGVKKGHLRLFWGEKQFAAGVNRQEIEQGAVLKSCRKVETPPSASFS
jgi:hypothetical protein